MRGGKGVVVEGILWAGGLLRPEARVLWAGKAFGGQRGSGGWHRLHVTEGGGQVGGVASGGGGAYLWDSSLYLLRGLRPEDIMGCRVWEGSGAGDYYGMVVQNGRA